MRSASARRWPRCIAAQPNPLDAPPAEDRPGPGRGRSGRPCGAVRLSRRPARRPRPRSAGPDPRRRLRRRRRAARAGPGAAAARRQPAGGRGAGRPAAAGDRPAAQGPHNAVLGYFVEINAGQGRPPVPAAAATPPSSTARPWPTRCASPPSSWPSWTRRIAQAAERALAIEAETFEAWRAEARGPGRADPGRRRGPGAAGRRRGPGRMGRGGAGAAARGSTAPWPSRPRRARHPVVEAAVRRDGPRLHPQRLPPGRRGRGRRRGWPSSPGPTWPASRPSCARTRCWPCWPRPARFVPARRLRLGVVDRLFSRVGAARRPGARPLDLHGRDGRDRGDPDPGHAALVGHPGRDRPRHGHLRRPGHRLGLRRGAARHQPLPRAVRHPLSRAGAGWRTGWPMSATCRCGPRSGTANWSSCTRPGPGRPTAPTASRWPSWPGVPAGRGRPRPPGAGPAGGRGRRPRRPGWTSCRCSPPPRPRRMSRAWPSPAPSRRQLGGLDLDGMSPREAMDALYRLKAHARIGALSFAGGLAGDGLDLDQQARQRPGPRPGPTCAIGRLGWSGGAEVLAVGRAPCR